jgi:glycosyltransferase involved in cell wall biosynthesis
VTPGRPRTTSEEAVLWILYGPEPPMTYVAAAYERFAPSAALYWHDAPKGQAPLGWALSLLPGDERSGMSINLVHPGMLRQLLRERAGTVVVQELNLIALYALASRLVRRRRRVVALIEGDILKVGRTGRARAKIWLRRFLVRHVDALAANNPDATRYLLDVLGAPPEKVHEGWWLAGLPSHLRAIPPADPPPEPEGPVVISVGRLIQLKAHDAVIAAAARYRREVGPLDVWIVGEGEEEPALRAQARAEGIAEHVHLLGQLAHEQLLWALRRSDVMAFPTRQDLVGRAAVEALSTGTPVLASRGAVALLHLVRDDRSGVVVEPGDPDDLFRGMRTALDPLGGAALRAEAAQVAEALRPEAAAAVIKRAVDAAHGRGPARA